MKLVSSFWKIVAPKSRICNVDTFDPITLLTLLMIRNRLTYIFFFFFKLIATLFIYLFIYLFLAVLGLRFVQGLSLVVASGGHSSSQCVGLSVSRPLPLRGTGSRRTGSAVVAHGPSCSTACGIFPDQGSNPCPLHWQADSQPLRHQGSPNGGIWYQVTSSLGMGLKGCLSKQISTFSAAKSPKRSPKC